MKHSKEPSPAFSSSLSIPLMVKKRPGQVEGADEVDHLLLDLALAKLGITDHRDIVFVWISVILSFFIYQNCSFTVLQ